MNVNRYSRWDWPVALLLVAAVFITVIRLEITNWTPDLVYVGTFAVLGCILGLALGFSQFKRRGLTWLVAGYTLVTVPAQLSGIITSEKTALGQWASFIGRLVASFAFLFNGKTIEDHLFFVTLMSILFWAIGIYSGYRLMRRPAILPVLLPSIIPILIIQYYDGFKQSRIWGLAVYFFIALILIGRMNLLKTHERWEQRQILAGSEPEFDLNKNIVIAAAIIIMAAWVLPTPEVVMPEAARAWHSFSLRFENTRERINDALAALQSGRPNTISELYGKTMGLGRTASTGKAELFSVRPPQNDLPRLYWRVRVYDIYLNGSWQTTNGQNTPFDPDHDSLIRSDILPSPSGEFLFIWQTNQSALLVTPTLPIWVSRTGSVQIATSKDGETDLLNWSVTPNLQAGDQYKIQALLLNPTIKELRKAGDNYPTWVKERYLQVPEIVKTDISHLAAQITAGKATTFDKAEAVTNYLRQNMTYSETIPSPPPGKDPVNWFLFGWKSGFCNYYASSEVLLLRSVGIPTRMVVGYAQGEGDGYGKYSIRGQNAHAWPEVYFPGIGWVEFEPTVNQFAIVRPSGDIPLPSESERITNQDRVRNDPLAHEPEGPEAGSAAGKATFWGITQEQWLWIIISTITVVCVGFSIWQLDRRKPFIHKLPRAVKAIYVHYNLKNPAWVDHWVRWSEVTGVERAFHAINQCLSWLHKPQPNHATPAERAELLKKLIPNKERDIDYLTAALEQTLYTPYPADAVNAIRAGWNIRIATLRKILFHSFNRE